MASGRWFLCVCVCVFFSFFFFFCNAEACMLLPSKFVHRIALLSLFPKKGDRVDLPWQPAVRQLSIFYIQFFLISFPKKVSQAVQPGQVKIFFWAGLTNGHQTFTKLIPKFDRINQVMEVGPESHY